MKIFSTFLLAGTLAAATAFTGLTAPAFADNNGGRDGQRMAKIERHDGQRRAGALFGLVCSDRGAERLEGMLDRVSTALTLTDEQKPLFDAFKTSALVAQSQFADTCAANMDPTANTLLDRMNGHKAMLTAQLTGMEAVTPSLETFYNGLTDEQKAKLDKGPRRRMAERDDRRGDHRRNDQRRGDHRHDWRQHDGRHQR